MLVLLVCALKGKWEWAIVGLVLWPVGLVSAFRLARPNSWWANRMYDQATKDRAIERFGSTKAIEHSKGGIGWECLTCGELFGDEETAVSHVEVAHAATRDGARTSVRALGESS